jgi:hypothetical protein
MGTANHMETILWIFITVEGAVALWGIGLLFFRRKYAEQLSSLPEQRVQAVLGSSRKMVKVIRILFWLSPIYLVLVPLVICYTFGGKWFVLALTIMALMYLLVLPEYTFRKRLLRYFSKLD